MRHQLSLPIWLAIVAAAAACTTMGPTPATTGFTARPMARTGLDLQVGLVPGHNLSSSVVESPDGNSIKQASLAAQYDELIGIPGLVLGARVFGNEGDTPLEPVIGYRRVLGDGVASIGGFFYGTHASHEEYGTSYEATRLGGELSTDIRILENRWVEPHLFGGLNVQYLSAEGTYCTDPMGQWAEDCAEPPDPPKPTTSATARGAYLAGHVGLAVEVMRHRDSWFHGGRIAFMLSGGTMPHVESSVQTDDETYAAAGLTFSVGIGAGDE
jgi:hypothetical protein